MDRDAVRGFRLDVPSGTSHRFEPGASREVAIVALRGARRVPGIQPKSDGALGPVEAPAGRGVTDGAPAAAHGAPAADGGPARG